MDDEIRTIVATIRNDWEALVELLERAAASELHTALGFSSWTAYVADVFDDNPLVLDRGDRRAAVKHMAEQGMSTRAIGAVLGVANTTVGRDLAIHDLFSDDADGRDVTGLDGATYKRPRATRSDLVDPAPREKRPTVYRQASAIHQDLLTIVEAIEEIATDKRYNAHRDTVFLAFKPAFDRIDRVRLFLMGDISKI
jgi:Trp operon repressor